MSSLKALIVLAHPERASFNAALANVGRKALESQGHEVRICDLHEREFAPDEHGRHYQLRKDASRFDAQTEQRHGAQHGTLPRDVQRELDDLLWADLLVLQFPLWWFGLPAILKGWMDRVFVYGKIYSGSRRLHTGVCRGKRAMLSVTAGSSAEACAHDGQEGDTRLILWPINYALHYVGFTVLEPALITGVRGGFSLEEARAQEQYLEAQLSGHRARFANLDAIPTVPFNTADDWDAQRRLKPHAPVHSPFIRHESVWRADTRPALR